MPTVGDQINRGLRLIGVLAEGESPSAETSEDALVAFNQMLDSWSTERLSVYATQDQAFNWPASTSQRTLGASGNFVGNRPIQVLDSTYFRDTSNDQDYPIRLVNQDEYNSIVNKTITSTYPQVLFVNYTNPNATMNVYPVHTSSTVTFHFISISELTQPALITTSLALPPGYLRAVTYNFACEMAPEFGVTPSAQVQRIAVNSKRNIKRINNPDDLMSLPTMLIATNWRYNINTD